ncbi:hypothetical protein [Spiroplasma tabanidicola]|uniref:Uncharacterized protein n=1 Tax=Spiroplasma tabanidicola TaxID=324079 RepID=A0A6I6C8L6_9MOLU|nr:hypothetical protein [Spiroplasma tabanidicola]QGS51799.1 hypothetical protein STABA_v1c04360 [Spiroplasma tabanidicola]
MCCNCKDNILNNCSCSIYEVECNLNCCWCCLYSRMVDFEAKKNFFNILITDFTNVLAKQKHLKVIKKVLKNSLKDLNECEQELKIIKAKNYISLINSDNDIENIVKDIELDLGLKIRNIIKQWEIYIEISYLILDLDKSYFSKKTYKNLSDIYDYMNDFLFELAKLFKTIVFSQDNASFIYTIQENFIDLDKTLKNFHSKLEQ